MGFTCTARAAALLLSVVTSVALLSACRAEDGVPSARGTGLAAGAGGSDAQPVITGNVTRGEKGVPVDRRLRMRVAFGTLQKVVATPRGGTAPTVLGTVADDGRSWTARSLLEPGTRYILTASATGPGGGTAVTRRFTFRTQDLTLDQQIYPSVAPLAGETVGVGMPVIVTFDLPVRDKAAFERHMRVTSTPAQRGAWHWMSDTEAHWRPARYWRAGTQVKVDVGINSVAAGGGFYGQEDRQVSFRVGASHVYRVNAQTHRMKVFVDGKQVRDFPITTGKDGFTTRSGTKVIVEKFASKRMRSETVGIGQGNPEYYDLDNVQWAMRLTFSGEFIHAAPWSVGSQGHANVSHGCTGMSTADAKWLFDLSRRGDVVEYTGTDRPMTLTNGYGDWNVPFSVYREGSALR